MNPGCAVVMPQMGASISEGTITRWLVEVGSRVERDQHLFEISTDKVDAAIPSPISGVLREILYPAGATVPVDTVVAWIGPPEEGGAEPLGGRESLQEAAPQALSGGTQKTASNQARILWVLFALFFGARLLWRLYSFTHGETEIDKALFPGAAFLYCVAHLVTDSGSLLYKLLALVSGVLLLAALVALAL